MDFSFGHVAMHEPVLVARKTGNSDWLGFSSTSSVRNLVGSTIVKLNEYYRTRSKTIPQGRNAGQKKSTCPLEQMCWGLTTHSSLWVLMEGDVIQ